MINHQNMRYVRSVSSLMVLQSTAVHSSSKLLQSWPKYIVSPKDIQICKRDGVVCLRNVLSAGQCAEVYEASIDFMKEKKGFIRYAKGDQRFFSAAYMSKTVRTFEDFAKHSQLPHVAAQLMNNIKQVRFFYDQLFIKAPGTQAKTAWHNDLSYWPFRGNDLISLWCALTPVKRETSGVEYIPGTHLKDTLYQAITPDEDKTFIDPSRPACPDFSNDSRLISYNMVVGDVPCHHPLVIHGSGANNSLTEQRVGLSIRYLGEDVRWCPSDYGLQIHQDGHRLIAGQNPADDNIFPPLHIYSN